MLRIRPTKTVTAAPNNSSVAVQLPDATSGLALHIWNPGATIAFLALGGSTVSADATGAPCPPSQWSYYARNPGESYAAIFSTGNETIYIVSGDER